VKLHSLFWFFLCEVSLLYKSVFFHRAVIWLYCFRIYDISGSSDEKSEDSDNDSDDDEEKGNKVKKAVTGMPTVQTFLQL